MIRLLRLALPACALVPAFWVLLEASPVPAQPEPAAVGPPPLFRQFDQNHDGRLSWGEAWGAVERLFAAADTNHDGALTLEEWTTAQLPGRPAPNRASAEPDRQRDRRLVMFRALDANRDSRVTLAEIRPVAEAWFRAFDANADGALAPEELPRPRVR